jgi:hypothetical protein
MALEKLDRASPDLWPDHSKTWFQFTFKNDLFPVFMIIRNQLTRF